MNDAIPKSRYDWLVATVVLQAKPSNETHYFGDGVRRIDMVLAYEDHGGKSTRKREVFEKHLREEGLELETENRTVTTKKYLLN